MGQEGRCVAQQWVKAHPASHDEVEDEEAALSILSPPRHCCRERNGAKGVTLERETKVDVDMNVKNTDHLPPTALHFNPAMDDDTA